MRGKGRGTGAFGCTSCHSNFAGALNVMYDSANGEALMRTFVALVFLCLLCCPAVGQGRQLPAPDKPLPGFDQYIATLRQIQSSWDGWQKSFEAVKPENLNMNYADGVRAAQLKEYGLGRIRLLREYVPNELKNPKMFNEVMIAVSLHDLRECMAVIALLLPSTPDAGKVQAELSASYKDSAFAHNVTEGYALTHANFLDYVRSK